MTKILDVIVSQTINELRMTFINLTKLYFLKTFGGMKVSYKYSTYM